MAQFFATLKSVWVLLFGWMPPLLAAFCTVVIGLVVIILLIKVIALILDAIPFL